ncbi:hypothetical protein O7627_07165 [Solwaraspora sp. WMMD1047]|uniref:hypothetical protein n=1 Tax=Solwaraspora sp. WMMD1047 TaxID=3016102 RepID=UPI002415E218|nr:hypothetical protein [Solwaraspora sp. WMMD1047]MDG4829083.1 hypothetical protein [Solwaraspora sp. WMMD1047]
MSRRPIAQQPRAHVPQRPLWLCRRCAQPWPCGEARLALLHEYADDPARLRIYLTSCMHDALADLLKLNPETAPTAETTFTRFLAWTAPRAARDAADPAVRSEPSPARLAALSSLRLWRARRRSI